MTITQDHGTAGDALQLPLLASILKILPIDQQREAFLELDAGEQRWIADQLAALDAQAGPPPF